MSSSSLPSLFRSSRPLLSLHELRISFSPSSPSSPPLTNFILANYKKFKSQNPHLPVLVREAEGAKNAIVGRFDFGVEERIELEGASDAGVREAFEKLVNRGKKEDEVKAKEAAATAGGKK